MDLYTALWCEKNKKNKFFLLLILLGIICMYQAWSYSTGLACGICKAGLEHHNLEGAIIFLKNVFCFYLNGPDGANKYFLPKAPFELGLALQFNIPCNFQIYKK